MALLKTLLFLSIFGNMLFANPFANEEEMYAEDYEYRLKNKISTIDNSIGEVDGLIDNNLNCINGTELMITNKVCYQTFLAIQEVIKRGKNVNYYSQKLERECPEVYDLWSQFEDIKICK
jgi:hypothetical protein